MADINLGELTDQLYRSLKDLDRDTRSKVVRAALLLCGDGETASSGQLPWLAPGGSKSMLRQPSFSEREDISAKDFLKAKQPASNADRVACLAYYLTHYLETPHFRTIDISRLNTEAAQPKFTNATQSVKDAIKKGLVVAAGKKGLRQLSAAGEDYVNGLPDRAEAKAALMAQQRRRSRARSKASRKTKPIE